MEELYTLSIDLHKFFSICIFVLIFTYLYFVNFNKKNFVKRIRLFLPIFYTFLSLSVFTGLVVMAILKFNLSHKIIVMIIASIVILVTNIIGYKKLKSSFLSGCFINYKKQMNFILISNLILVSVASFM